MNKQNCSDNNFVLPSKWEKREKKKRKKMKVDGAAVKKIQKIIKNKKA